MIKNLNKIGFEFEGPRSTRIEEYEEVINLINLVFRTTKNQPPQMEEEYPLLLNRLNINNLLIILSDGKPVSHVGKRYSELISPNGILKIASLGSVCTHPDYRGRGLATTLIKYSFNKAEKDMMDMVLISGRNPIYKKAGCQNVEGFSQFEIPAISGKTLFEKVSETGKIEKVLAKIYNAEPIRFKRSVEEFSIGFLVAQAIEKRRAKREFFLDKNAQAYIVLQRESDIRKDGCGEVIEYAGNRRIISSEIDKLTALFGLNKLNFVIPAYDVELSTLLEDRFGEAQSTVLPGHTYRWLWWLRSEIWRLPRLPLPGLNYV